MSNKIALATIQFRADAKGANAALESLRQSSKDAHDEAERMREALDRGIKTMKDANGVDFDVARKFSEMTKQAKNFDQAIRELVKGATALETVVKNIRIGEIEASSRAELKGAINAAEARKRSVRETDPEDLQQQRELNIVIEESRKQLNNLDRDTQKVIETLDRGGTIAQSTLEKEMKGLREILTMIPKGTDEWNKYNQQLQQMETHVTNIRRQEREQASALLGSKDLGQYSEEDIRAAITNAKELLATYKTASPEAKQLADNIVRAEQFLKGYGVEAARQAAHEAEQLRLEKELATTMNKRLRDLKNLSADALEETRRYWEAQRNGAAEGTTEFNKAEAALKKIDGYTRSSRRTELTSILGDPSKFGVSEVKAAVQEAEKLRDSVQKGIPVWFQYNKMVEQGMAYLDQMAKSEAAERINQQMKNLNTTLSDAGLQEVKKYWETMVSGAEKGSRELADYEAKLKEVIAEEQSRKTAAQQRSIDLFASRDLGGYSEKEIREAIEAGKQLIQTYNTADPAAKQLAENIVRAEEHLKQYGVEAERTAAREQKTVEEAAKKREESHQAMEEQLRRGTGLTQSALRAQEQYWQRMADDPKAASNEIARYFENLNKVRALQKEQEADLVKGQGVSALQFFRGDTSNASADQIKEQADALKKYRNSLPRKDNADLLIEIDSYLAKSGQVAKEATGELMNLGEALEMAGKAGKDGFSATEDEIKKAIASIEKAIEIDRELVKQHRRAGNTQMAEYNEEEIKEYEKALKGLDLELKNVGISHGRMQKILENPINANNLDELRAAIKRAKAELNSMDGALGENRKQYDEMAKSVKQAEQQLKVMEGQARGTASAFEKAWSRLKTYVGLYVGASVAMNKLMGTMGDLMDLSDKMGEVRKTTGFTADEVGRLSGELKKMDTRTTLNGLLDLSVAAGQLGLKTEEDVLGFTEAANKLMVALPEMGKEGATEMLKVALATGEIDKIRKQMEQGLIDGSSATAVAMEKVGSTIDRLRATSAATAPAITDFVKRVGAVGAQSGITIDQVAALGSTVDALGMRVEMSATALSRMIPAIKNNAFAVAKAIGVTPETLRSLFEAGKGMEAILMIFDHIKKSNMDEDSIEKMLGMGGMQEVMKELNQMGARAGIVFAGLSQNVDELRRQLGVAGEAYEKNIAIQQEYDKMNETTMAKWQRFKNDIEEMFVGDFWQRQLGNLIDFMREFVKWFADGGPVASAFQMMLMYAAAMKAQFGAAFVGIGGGFKTLTTGIVAGVNVMATSLGALINKVTGATDSLRGVRAATIGARREWVKMDAAMRANVVGAIITALTLLAYKLWNMHQAAKEAAAEIGRFNQKMYDEKKALDSLFEPLNKSNLAQKDRAALMAQINSTYGKYLGYMVSETMSATQLAEAHALIAKRIREEAYERRIMEKERQIQQEHNEDLNAAYGKITDRVRSGVRGGANAQEIADVLKGIVDNRMNDIKYAYDNSDNIFSTRTRYYLDPKIKQAIDGGIERLVADGKLSRDNVAQIQKAVYAYTVEAKSQHDDIMSQTSNMRSDLRGIQGAIKTDLTANLRGLIGNIASLAKQPAALAQAPAPQGPMKPQQQSFTFGWGQQQQNGSQGWGLNFGGQQQQQPLQMPLPGQKPKIDEKNTEKVRQYIQDQDSLRSFIKEHAENISESDRKAAEAWLDSENEIERLRKLVAKRDASGGGGGTNPWGSNQPAESTDWKNMTAEQLVNRRKQMKDFVNAIQTDTDVQSVLKEDAALRKAIEKGMSSDMRTVIEWYNTERLKIQDELHARHLTNTGDWMDPKKQRNAHKQFQNEVKAYLEELDAYYTERNQKIQDARNNEEITEGEAWRRTIKNETEWHNRRAELQKLYAEKGAEVTKEEQDAIFAIIAQRTGDDEKFIRQMIQKTIGFAKEIEKTGEKGAAVVHKWRADLGLGWERDYLKSAQSIGKQMKFIEDTLAKERPYDGITKNLQENLDKMGVLAAQYKRINDELEAAGKEKKYSDAEITAQTYKEMAFYLRQAEDAWSIDIDKLLRRMAEEGMATTAEEISKSDMLKQAVMGQLRKTYQEVQDAVKKEASQIKKNVEIIWNDEAQGIGGKSMKSMFDQAIARLGMQQDSVSRANGLIGAGVASDNVATRLAMKQIEVQMRMQKVQYDMYRTQANQRIAMLKAEAAEHERIARQMKQENNLIEEARQKTLAVGALKDAENVKRSLGLTLAEETKKEEEQMAELLKLQEESQNRLYQELRSWADLLTSSLQSVFEASHTADREYYNERAKLDLTGKGGPGAGTYIVINDEGTSDARAHYEYLDERQALERQREIENDNAVADAWKKMMDDLNQKMSDTITDQVNAMLQNESIDANTTELQKLQTKIDEEKGRLDGSITATDANTEAVNALTRQLAQGITISKEGETGGLPAEEMTSAGMGTDFATDKMGGYPSGGGEVSPEIQKQIDENNLLTETRISNKQKETQVATVNDKKQVISTQSAFAKMTAAANLYGTAYQVMANDNMDASQKFQLFAVQAAGQAAIAMLTTNLATTQGQTATELPGILGKAASQLGPIAGPIAFAAMSALLGGLMGLAVSKIAKSKSTIAQVTGASVGAGRLSTGMLTYAEGNVNEFTDPGTLTPGRSYNVDAADGRTYRAKYTGTNPKTHITNGPEFHLSGEKGREMIIDAGTTRQITMNEAEIWHAIQTLSGGGRMRRAQRSGRGVRAFADGNLDDFEEMAAGGGLAADGGMGMDQLAAFQQSLDRNSAIMERLADEGIEAFVSPYGKRGIVNGYDTYKKEAQRHGEKYM